MKNEQKLANLMTKDDFNDWSKLLESSNIRKFIFELNASEFVTRDLTFIRKCIHEGRSFSNIKLMLALSPERREAIRKAFLTISSEEKVIYLMKSGLEAYKIDAICSVLGENVTYELIDLLKKDFDKYQVGHICLGVTDGLSIKEIKVFAKEDFSCDLMNYLIDLLLKKHPINKIKLVANPALEMIQVEVLTQLIEAGVSYAKLKIVVDTIAYDRKKFYSMASCAKTNMTAKEMQEIITLSKNKINAIRDGFEKHLPASYKEYCMKLDLERDQFLALARAFESEIDESKIAMIAKPDYSDKFMHLFINCARQGFSNEQLTLLISAADDELKFEKLALAISEGKSSEELDSILKENFKTREKELLNKLMS